MDAEPADTEGQLYTFQQLLWEHLAKAPWEVCQSLLKEVFFDILSVSIYTIQKLLKETDIMELDLMCFIFQAHVAV